MPFPLSTDNFHFSSWFFKDWYFVLCKLLISSIDHFVFSFQVEPELKSNRILIIRSWHLRMYYTFTSGHPLDIAGSYNPFMPTKILMVEASLFHIGNSFEPTMRMIRKSSRQSNFKMIKHQERVKSN